MFIFRPAVVLVAAIIMLASAASAQTSRGTVTGIVIDASAAAMPNASVELKGRQTGVSRTTTTNESGVYRFDAVDLGEYDLTVKATGFKTLTNRSVNVQAAQTVSIDAQLEVGDNVTVIDVSAEAVQLQTEAPVRGGNISSSQAIRLPYASRNPSMLAINLPGVNEQRQAAAGISTFSVNGARGRSNNFLLNGTENNDISVAGQAFQIKNPEAVAEVSIQTSNFDAEFGRAGGAVINVITKSGTNSLHGSASYLVDVTNDDAITNTQSLDPAIRQRGKMLPGSEQYYSGTLGGPIVKDRTFFFVSWQEQRQRSTSQVNLTTLSQAGRDRLRELFPQGTNPRADLYLNLTAGAIATGQLTQTPLGGGRGSVQNGTALYAFPQKLNARQISTKIDHRLGDADMLALSYNHDRTDRPQFTQNLPGLQTSTLSRFNNIVLTETHVFSPSFTNELRLPFNRIVFDSPADTENPIGATLPLYTLTPFSNLGVPTNIPQGRIANNFALQDTLNYVRGKHSFRFGIDLLNQRARQSAPIVVRGNIAYSVGGGYETFANFLDDFGGSTGSAIRDFGDPIYYPELFRQAYFFQDRWQMTQGLTVTLGLRYENFGTPMNSVPTPAFTGLFNIDPRTGLGPFNQPNEVKADNNNFGPAVGITYSPSFDSGFLGTIFGNRKTVFRTGYNITYDSFFNNIASNNASSAPNLIATQFVSRSSNATDRGVANFSSYLPTTPRALTPKDAQGLVVGDLVNPYYQRWSFGIQRELPGNTVFETAYVGSSGVRLYIQEDLNPTVPESMRILPAGFSSLGELQSALNASANPYTLEARLDPMQGARGIRTNGGHSSYHSLQTEVRKRFTNRLGFSVAWTWAKLLDNSSEIFQYNNTSPVASYPAALGGQPLERGISLYDRTHRLSLTYLYELPFFQSQQGFAGRVLGGWQIAGVTTFESGVPYSASNGVDSDAIGGANRPDFNPAGKPGVRAQYVGPPTAANPFGYVNPDVWDPATGSYISVPIDPREARYIGLPTSAGRTGNAGRNLERVPGLKNWNVNIMKNVRITERFSSEFRTEFYNIWNTPQYGYFSVSPFTPGEGTIASNVSGSLAGRFLNPTFLEAGGRVIRYQLTVRF